MDKTKYLFPYENYFWHWEENGEVISIPGGLTLLYSEYFFTRILPHFENEPIPDFNVFILLLTTLGIHGEERYKAALAEIRKVLLNQHHENGFPQEEYKNALLFLQTLSQLPSGFQKETMRIKILRLLFSRIHKSVNKNYSSYLIELYRNRNTEFWYNEKNANLNSPIISDHLKTLRILHTNFPDVDSIIKELTPQELKDSFTLNEKPDEEILSNKDFIQALSENYSTSILWQFMHQIWAGLHIPFAQTASGYQTLGGVSDISNKGDFSRLLLTEFANDETVFVSRLANNEALYIQREVPPINEKHKRIILFDHSLRNWGMPRLIGFSTMLALLKHEKANFEFEVYLIGNSFEKMELNTVENVIQAFDKINACENSSLGFLSFIETFRAIKTTELFVICGEDSKDPIMKKSLQTNTSELVDYWIVTDSTGKIDVYQTKNKNRRCTQSFNIDFNNLKKLPLKTANKRQNFLENDSNCPILFPVSPFGQFFQFSIDKYSFYTCRNGALYKFKISDTPNEVGERISKKGLLKIKNPWVVVEINQIELVVQIINGVIVIKDFLGKIDFQSSKYTTELISTSKMDALEECILLTTSFNFPFTYRQLKISLSSNNTFNENSISVDLSGFIKNNNQVAVSYISNNQCIFKIKRVFINTSGNLVVNNHELFLNTDIMEFRFKRNKFKVHDGKTGLVESKFSQEDNGFLFNDGTLIRIDSGGVFTIDTPTNRKRKYIITCTNNPYDIVSCIKLLKRKTDLPLYELKSTIENHGSILYCTYLEADAKRLFEELNHASGKSNAFNLDCIDDDQRLYIPSVLDKHLIVSTNKLYAGNDLFVNSKFQNLQKITPITMLNSILQPIYKSIINSY